MYRPKSGEPQGEGGAFIVHSHLRWDFVWQRPQQIFSRLRPGTRTLFLEEPIYRDDVSMPRLDLTEPFTGVHRAIPLLPARLSDRPDESLTTIRDLVRREMVADGRLAGMFERPVQWFYTPMPAPTMIGAFNERGVVYDCMDELSKFRFAPAELVDRERYLLSRADVVFTGGYRLWESKSRLHGNVHYFGCGVDVGHFSAAAGAALAPAPELARLPHPIAGYYGVIDERIDYDLIRLLAKRQPELSVVMVGPVVKVALSELPQAPNIHWLGQRDYSELPALVKGFDVCLMPFARNESTEYINPTKTLEYMAARKPIVSTNIGDVKRNFAPVVAVAESAEAFIVAVEAAITEPCQEMLDLGLTQAFASSWEEIVNRMERTVYQGLHARDERGSATLERPRLRDGVRVKRMTRSAVFATPQDVRAD